MKYLALLAGTLYLFACSDKDSGTGDCPTDEYEYTIKANSRIDTLTSGNFFSFQISGEGDKTVFIYTHNNNRCQWPVDGGYSENLVFEIPANATSFSYTNEELKNANTWYKKSCFCADINAHAVVVGIIKGQKLSATTWKVDAVVAIPAKNKAISFNKTFRVQ